jgi:hypothetical protein
MTVSELIEKMTAMVESGEVRADSEIIVGMNGGEYESDIAEDEVQSRCHRQFGHQIGRRRILFLDL